MAAVGGFEAVFCGPASPPGVLSHGRHQFLKAHQAQDVFEVVGQGGQAPFTLHFGQALEEKVGVTKPALDGAEGMLGQGLS